jgi:hypothetical protein
MIYIAHRGNITGPDPKKENHPDYLRAAVKAGYHVELDVRYLDGSFILGHDNPQYEVHKSFLSNNRFWVHAKDINTLHLLMDRGNYIHCFFHDTDDATITSQGWIWTYPGKPVPTARSIVVMPERIPEPYNISLSGGICSDYVEKYKILHRCHK